MALYTGSYRLSKRTTQQMMDEVFGVPMSVGTISPLEQATTAAVAVPVEEARSYVHEQAVASLDETRWRQGDKRAWLWVAVTSWVTVFVVRMSRGGHVARELLGEQFAGILVTDRYSAYNWYPVRWRQVCWAHLLRDFEAMRGRGGCSEAIGDEAEPLDVRVFATDIDSSAIAFVTPPAWAIHFVTSSRRSTRSRTTSRNVTSAADAIALASAAASGVPAVLAASSSTLVVARSSRSPASDAPSNGSGSQTGAGHARGGDRPRAGSCGEGSHAALSEGRAAA